jgi:DNA-directed RNA polymerase beta subunit
MTIAQLLESVLGKACCMEGTFGDGTPFTSNSTDIAESICKRLKENGFERHGNECLINGMTGEMIDAQVFCAPVFYQRLKHMVSDKLHSRSQGHVTTLTRQPLNRSNFIISLYYFKKKKIDIYIFVYQKY